MRGALLFLPLLLWGGCSQDPPGLAQVSDDLELQARYETAHRALAEVQQLKARGHDVHAECTTLKMLFVKPLKKLQARPARALAKQILKTCQDVRPRQ